MVVLPDNKHSIILKKLNNQDEWPAGENCFCLAGYFFVEILSRNNLEKLNEIWRKKLDLGGRYPAYSKIGAK